MFIGMSHFHDITKLSGAPDNPDFDTNTISKALQENYMYISGNGFYALIRKDKFKDYGR